MRRSRYLVRVLASVVAIAFTVEGCATTGSLVGPGSSPTKSALICGAGGALVGAAAGAAIGAAGSRSGHQAAGALVGALIGGAVGAITAATACFTVSYASRAEKDYRQTGAEVGYQPSQGNALQITEFRVIPAVAAPGTKVQFAASYYAMSPEPEQDLTIVETRIVTSVNTATGERKKLGEHTNQIVVKPGSRRGDGEFELRSGVAEGQYEVTFQVEFAGQRDQQTLALEVTRNQATLRDPDRQVARVTAEPAGAKLQEAATKSEPASPAPPVQVGAPVPTSSSPPVEQPLSALGEQNPAPPPAAVTALAVSGTPVTVAAKVARERYFVASKLKGPGNLREGPGTKYRIVGTLAIGDRFFLLDTVTPAGNATAWHKVRLEDGREAWVSSLLGDEVLE